VKIALAVTVHDPGGHIAPGVRRTADALRTVFSDVAANATDLTHLGLLNALRDAGAAVITHQVGNVAGRSRRDAVALALRTDAERILYSDLDHAVRWIEQEPHELGAVINRKHAEDVVIVGRDEQALQRSPARLRQTEAIVNHVYKLVSGRETDLMFAVRLLSRSAAEAIVASCVEDTMASDVEWPMFAENSGYSVGHVAANGLDYRTTADFDTAADVHDHDPEAWIHRVELAAQHLAVMRRLMSVSS
jgi:hypothetical protein